jgi:hypothetical protein
MNNNKIEIFKLAIAAGSETYTEEQINFLVECFKKAEKLSTPQVSGRKVYQNKGPKPTDYKSTGYKPKGPKPEGPKTGRKTGRFFFIGTKLAELEQNGLSYQENKKTAFEAWQKLSVDDKKIWDDRAIASELDL